MFNLVMMMFIYGSSGSAPANQIPTAGSPIIVGQFSSRDECIKAAKESSPVVEERGPAQVGTVFTCARAR